MSHGKKFDNVWNKDNSLFAIWIGTLDVVHLNRKNATIEIDEITDSLFNIINKIYDVGARNFLIFEVFPLYLNPYNLNGKHNYFKNYVLEFNNNILKKSKILFEKYSDINIIIYNTVKKFENIIFNCKKYKFKDCRHAWNNKNKKKKKYSINKYFWNNSHITYSGNKLLAKDINDLLNLLNK